MINIMGALSKAKKAFSTVKVQKMSYGKIGAEFSDTNLPAPAPRPFTRAPTAWIGKSGSYDKFPPFGWVLSVSPSLPNPFCHARAAQLEDHGHSIRWFLIKMCVGMKNLQLIGRSFIVCFDLFKVIDCIE